MHWDQSSKTRREYMDIRITRRRERMKERRDVKSELISRNNRRNQYDERWSSWRTRR
jgi:hypothetical protein